VCTNSRCCDFKDSGKNDSQVVTIYNTHCHADCYLDHVDVDAVAHASLVQCAAFQGTNFYTLCKHQWQEHMHVLYGLEEVNVQITDSEIQR
jgi:hypothetical protein